MNEQHEAIQIANALELMPELIKTLHFEAAAELRRLHEVNQELVKALEDILSELYGEVDGPFFDIARAAIAKAKGESNE